MKISAQECWYGGSTFTFSMRYTVQTGKLKGTMVEFYTDSGHNRTMSTIVRDYFEREYKIPRNSIKIDVL